MVYKCTKSYEIIKMVLFCAIDIASIDSVYGTVQLTWRHMLYQIEYII